MAAALARASSFAGQRRDSALAEMMDVRGGRVAPEASAFPGVPGCMHGLRGRVGRKTRCFFTDFAFDDQVLRRGRLPHLARDRHQTRGRCTSSAFAPELDLAAPQRS